MIKKYVIFLFVLFFFSPIVVDVFSDEYRDDTQEQRNYNATRTIKNVDGLNFVVQEDRPIEKVGGIYKPMDIDTYVAKKFDEVQDRIDKLQDAFNQKIDTLTQKLNELSDIVDKLSAGQTGSGGNQTQAEAPAGS